MAGSVAPVAFAGRPDQPAAVQGERSSALVAGEEAAKQLLLLMDRDKSGKVSRQEFMSFMEAEFDRLDKDKSGELDVNELRESQFRAVPPPFSLAGK